MKILLLYASLGAGHKRAAQALQEVLRERGIEHENRDLLAFLPVPMPWFYDRSYNFMMRKSRRLWRLVYQLLDRPKWPYRPARAVLQKWQFTALRKYHQDAKFSHIVSTHFTPSALLTDWRSQNHIHTKIFSVITDYSAHRCWKRDGLDHYFLPTEKVAAQLEAAGIQEQKITVSGIPISLAFSALMTRDESRSHWNCKPQDKVVLILCSALTLAKTIRVLEEVKTMDGDWHFLISTGPDPGKEERVKSIFSADSRFTIVGF